MFDYLRCRMPLPEPRPPKETVFQTKSVPTNLLWLSMWEITQDGRLLRIGGRWSPIDAPGAFPERLVNMGEDEPHQEIDFTGDIDFYTYSPEREWWTYTARFKAGQCMKIVLTEYSVPGGDWKNTQTFPFDDA